MTYMEEIKLTLANNECSIAENAYKKEEAERNLAKQIKELLDKNISKEGIANVIKLPIEDLNSLLEKIYPQTAGTEQTSDIESQFNFLKQQVQILQKKLDNQELENVQLIYPNLVFLGVNAIFLQFLICIQMKLSLMIYH